MSNIRSLELRPITTLAQAEAVAGKLSEPSKMPGYGYSIPAVACITGSKLRKVEGSICSKCYAHKGRYVFRRVKLAMWRRFFSLNHPQWVEAMAFMINYRAQQGYRHFRWHDSGDLQSHEHLAKIVEVCRRTPEVQHWLPTKELRLVREFGPLPENLTVRYSVPRVGVLIRGIGLPIATVNCKSDSLFQCQAYTREGKCGSCRACWDKSVAAVNYPLH